MESGYVISEMSERRRKFTDWLLAPFLALIIVGLILLGSLEQGYYYLKGYSWSPVYGGYWHRETGEEYKRSS